MSEPGSERPTTIEYGVDLTVTSAFGAHRGKGYHRCRYWTPEPDSAEEAKQMVADEKGVVEVHDVEAREVPAPEKWGDDDPRLMTDGGTERFEYLVIANCDHCDQEVKYVEEFEAPVALDRGVSIKWARCPYCGTGPGWWDVTEEYEIERVLPTQERDRDD